MERKKTIHSITNIKTLASLFVVYIHGQNIYGYGNVDPTEYFRPIFAFFNTAVPLFFVVSGYLQFRTPVNFKPNLIKKTKRLLIPFLIWNGFYIFLELIGHKVLPNVFSYGVFWGRGVACVRMIFGIPFCEPPFYVPLWYVRDLFILSFFAPYTQRILKKYPAMTFLVVMAIWFLPVNFYFRQAITFFFLGGLIATNKKIEKEIIKQRRPIFIVFILFLGIITSIINIDVIRRLSVLCLAYFVYQVCNKVGENKMCKRLALFSFAIYVLHGKVLSVLQIVWMKQWHGLIVANIGYCVLPIVVFASCFGIAVLFKKILPGIFAICMGE